MLGVAPLDRDSGQRRYRHCAHCGRARPPVLLDSLVRDQLRGQFGGSARTPKRSEQGAKGCGGRRHSQADLPAQLPAGRRPPLPDRPPRTHANDGRISVPLPSSHTVTVATDARHRSASVHTPGRHTLPASTMLKQSAMHLRPMNDRSPVSGLEKDCGSSGPPACDFRPLAGGPRPDSKVPDRPEPAPRCMT